MSQALYGRKGGVVEGTRPAKKLNSASATTADADFGQLAIYPAGPNAYIHRGDGNWSEFALGSLASDAQAQAKSSTSAILTASNLAAEGFLQWADVTLTSAQVKALAASPFELVAAPPTGACIMFHGALLKLNYGGTNVFTESGDNFGIKYTDDSGVQVSSTIETTDFIDQQADTYTTAIAAADAIVAAASAEAQALVLDNLGSEIAGNAANDNTLTVRVYYTVQSL